MKQVLYLALKYLQFNKGKTIVLILSISLILFLPAGLFVVVEQGSNQLTSRAETTPLLLGPKGSASDLTLTSLYFRQPTLDPITFEEVSFINESGFAYGIPLNVRYLVEDFPIVGTSLDYFEFRNLSIIEGRQLAMLGEAVLGSNAVKSLGVKVGDFVFSTPAGAFDVAGSYPLKMPVVGILEATGTPDDEGVFVDIKTAWIISGLAHGHEDVTKPGKEDKILEQDDQNVVANASLLSYTEITNENMDSFHFHGDPSGFPIDAVIVAPNSRKDGILLRGRFQERNLVQLLVPLNVIQELLDTVFVVRDYVTLASIGVAVSAFFIMGLVFMLSIRIRKREIETIKKIGGTKRSLTAILSSEIIIVVFSGILLATIFTLFISYFGDILLSII